MTGSDGENNVHNTQTITGSDGLNNARNSTKMTGTSGENIANNQGKCRIKQIQERYSINGICWKKKTIPATLQQLLKMLDKTI